MVPDGHSGGSGLLGLIDSDGVMVKPGGRSGAAALADKLGRWSRQGVFSERTNLIGDSDAGLVAGANDYVSRPGSECIVGARDARLKDSRERLCRFVKQ